MADIFISYAREDQRIAEKLATCLQQVRCTVWWDRSLQHGENFDHAIERELASATTVIVLWSRHANESDYVRSEAARADRFKKLIPLLIENCDLPVRFELLQVGNFTQWDETIDDPAFQELFQNLCNKGLKISRSPFSVEDMRELQKMVVSAFDVATLEMAIADHGLPREKIHWKQSSYDVAADVIRVVEQESRWDDFLSCIAVERPGRVDLLELVANLRRKLSGSNTR